MPIWVPLKKTLIDFYPALNNVIIEKVIPMMTIGGKMDDILKSIHIHPALSEIVRDAFRDAKEGFISQGIQIPEDIRYK